MKLERVKGMLKILEGAGVIATILNFFFGKKIEAEANEEAVGKYLEKHPDILTRAVIDAENKSE